MPQKTKERPMAKKKLLDQMAQRLFAYSFLKRAFIEEPTKEFLNLLLQEGFLENFMAKDENKQIQEGVETISFYLKDPDLLSEQNILELGADYVNLFIGPGKLPAPPYESVYSSKKRWVFQEETMQVREEYLRQNLISERYRQEPDDHIALELDFIRHLCDQTLKDVRANHLALARRNLNTQNQFLNEHLSKWAPNFSQKVAKNARTDFYRGAAKLLLGFLTHDKQKIEELLKNINLRIRQERQKKRATQKTKKARPNQKS